MQFASMSNILRVYQADITVAAFIGQIKYEPYLYKCQLIILERLATNRLQSNKYRKKKKTNPPSVGNPIRIKRTQTSKHINDTQI